MSMHEALRGLVDKVPWLSKGNEPQMLAPVTMTALEEMEVLVGLAKARGAVDVHSSTWAAVRSWAANELLATFARQESCEDSQSAGLRARAAVLREVLGLNEREREVKIEA